MKTGLILEGGAMRGMFSAGVMDVLMENGITFDGAIGVSAGAAFGMNYKSGQIGRVLRYNTRYVRDKRYCGLGVLLRTGNLYSADFCYDEVPRTLDPFDFDAYEKNPMEFYVTLTDVQSGRPVYHKYTGREDHCFDWIRASAALPPVSCPVEIDGKKYLDGGLADAIPIRFFERRGYDRNLVVLTRPADYRKGKTSMMPVMRLRYGKYPNVIRVLERRHRVYNGTLSYIAQKEAAGEILVLRPEAPLPLKRMERDPERLKEAYEIGRRTAETRLNEIVEFLKH